MMVLFFSYFLPHIVMFTWMKEMYKSKLFSFPLKSPNKQNVHLYKRDAHGKDGDAENTVSDRCQHFQLAT